MKIRLGLIDESQKAESYFNKLMHFYGNAYADRLVVSYFSSISSFREGILTRKIDVILVEESCTEDLTPLQEKMSVMYLTADKSIDKLKGIKAICRFDKPEHIYNEVLKLFSERDNSDIVFKAGGSGKGMVVTFMPVGGGTGASALAITYAKKMAKSGVKVVYLNLEILSYLSDSLEGEGNATFQDVIFAVKSKKANLPVMLEAYLCRDQSGVRYFTPAANPAQMSELNKEDIQTLIKTLQTAGDYGCIVVDSEFDFGEKLKTLSALSQRFYFVAEQSETSLAKAERLWAAIQHLERSRQIDLSIKLNWICNKAKNTSGDGYPREISISEYVPFQSGADFSQIVERLVMSTALEGGLPK